MDPAVFACEMWSLEHWTRAPETYRTPDAEAVEDFTHRNRNSHWWRHLVYYGSFQEFEQLHRTVSMSHASHMTNTLFFSLLTGLFDHRNDSTVANIVAWYREKGFKFPKFAVETNDKQDHTGR